MIIFRVVSIFILFFVYASHSAELHQSSLYADRLGAVCCLCVRSECYDTEEQCPLTGTLQSRRCVRVYQSKEPGEARSAVKYTRGERASRIPNMLHRFVLYGYFYTWEENVSVKRRFITLCKMIIYLLLQKYI